LPPTPPPPPTPPIDPPSPPPPKGNVFAGTETTLNGGGKYPSVAMFNRHFGVTCSSNQADTQVDCSLQYMNQYNTLTIPTGAEYVNEIPGARFPTVDVFDERNGIVCYARAAGAPANPGAVFCRTILLNIVGHPDTAVYPKTGKEVIEFGTEVAADAAFTVEQQFTVKAMEAPGAPASWMGRRAMLCARTTGFGIGCKMWSLTFSLWSPEAGVTQEDGNAPGILTPHALTQVVADVTTTSPGPRMHENKALTVFDYFNGAVCYTEPVNPCASETAGWQVNNWYQSTGVCNALSIDVATGTIVTAGAPVSLPGGVRVNEMAVSAFRSKAGDPTRALVCYVTMDIFLNDQSPISGGQCTDRQRSTRYRIGNRFIFTLDAQNSDYNSFGEGWYDTLTCDVMSRKGTTITFLNSARSAAGLGTDGVPVTQALRSYLTSGIMFSQRIGMIKDPTITQLDEYNALVCYTVGAQPHVCSHNTQGSCSTSSGNDRSITNGNDGFDAPAGNGQVQCTSVWIEGYGSSTYISDDGYSAGGVGNGPGRVGAGDGVGVRHMPIHDTVASASAPVNVGVTTLIGVGPHIPASGLSAKSYPFVTSLYSYGFYAALLCWSTAAASSGTCTVMTPFPERNTWNFNAPVDCINGYNCPTTVVHCPPATPYKCNDAATCVADLSTCPVRRALNTNATSTAELVEEAASALKAAKEMAAHAEEQVKELEAAACAHWCASATCHVAECKGCDEKICPK
jgi:hypothetical protein